MVSLIKASKRNKAGTLSFTIPLEITESNNIKKGERFSVSTKGKNIFYTPSKNKDTKESVKASPRNKKGTLSFTIPKTIVETLKITEKNQFLVDLEGKSIRFSQL